MNEARLYSVFKNQSQFMVLLSVEGMVFDINDSSLKASGLKHQDVVGKFFWDVSWWLNDRDNKAVWQQRLQQAAETRAVIHVRDVFKSALGNVRTVECMVTAIYDQQDRLDFYIVQATDITDRLIAERSIEDTVEQLDFALQSAHVGHWSWEIPTNRMTLSPEAALIFGVEYLPLYDHSLFQNLLHTEDYELVQITLQKAMQNHEAYDAEYRICRPDGRIVWINAKGRAIYDLYGKAIGMVGIIQDVTERKVTEHELAEERETLETLSRLAPSFATIMDVETMVQIATDQATKLTGAHFGAFFYNSLDESGEAMMLYTLSGAPKSAFSSFPMPRMTAVFEPTFHGGQTVLIHDVKTDPRYGKTAPYNGMPYNHLPVSSYLSVPVISRDGEAMGCMLFGHPDAGVFDARAAKLAEGIAAHAAIGIDNARLYEQVKQSLLKAEAANIAKTEFLANMSHEIRTPMNAVIGLARILSTSQPLTPKQQEYIKTLQLSAGSLLALINDLLDISKIETKTLELEETPFCLVSLIEDVVDMMSVQARNKGFGIEFIKQQGPNTQATFIGDSARIQQILVNLASNAVKFTEEGSVTIKLDVQDAQQADMREVIIIVEDTGIGIAANKQSAIFEKFVQADSSISRKYGGTGLGLAITKTLANALGGNVKLYSEEGTGSIFTLNLPLKIDTSAPVAGEVSAAEQIQTVQKPKILLVEDHEANILVATAFLEHFDCDYDVARNGFEAVDMVQKNRYHVVLMDVQMPEMNGLEATRAIRDLADTQPCCSVPIIGMTANALSGDEEICLSAGMNDYIVKPFDPEMLRKKIYLYYVEDKEHRA